MNSTVVKHISECFIKPKHLVEESNRPYYLTPSDLSMLSFHYIQKGLLFTIPSHLNHQQYSIHNLLESLKESLSTTLIQFYPLAGQLSTQTDEDRHECLVFVDCNKGRGAKFIHATLDLTISDIISTRYVPQVVHALFDHDLAVNCDGHTLPLLSVQVTELLDGVFIGCSINHAIVDGTSYWQFWNTWSKIHSADRDKTPKPQFGLLTQEFRFLNGCGPEISLPFMHADEIVSRYQAPQLKEKFFHFSSSVVMKLKTKANHDSKTNTISSFQALTAFVWKSVVRATSRPANEVTKCRLAINNRPRFDPPLPNNYFGNCVNVLATSTTVDELLNHDLGWVASQLHHLVVNYNDKVVRDELEQWLISPVFFRLDMLASPGITMSSSPRFDMYGNDFGLGKPVAVRSGSANKFPGSVTACPGREGGGSVELEICLPLESMIALELDEEFMAAASLSNT
ncbi:putative acetyltransferase At3g50280 [Silene latifolia]|uniref:putative acetyltransferase At3g50280 n=1 Tax=Silene latifolia TaxID=37657 RepID=UPI003D7700BC